MAENSNILNNSISIEELSEGIRQLHINQIHHNGLGISQSLRLSLSTSKGRKRKNESRDEVLWKINQQGGSAESNDERDIEDYQSYGNLINIYCCKCKQLSKNFTYSKCIKCCQLSVQFQCVKCNNVYQSYQAVLRHIVCECYRLASYQCSICKYTTCSKCSFAKHCQEVHSTLNNQSEYSYVHKKKYKKQ